MQTETKTVTQLPIMKYFDDAKLVVAGKETLGKWRKGEKPIGAGAYLCVLLDYPSHELAGVKSKIDIILYFNYFV